MMYYSLSINLLVLQLWSAYSQDQDIPAPYHQVRRVETGELPAGIPVSYKCTFTNLWTEQRHTNSFPGSPHWSPMLIASHNKGYSMWSPDTTSSSGVELMAETGSLSTLTSELDAAGGKVANHVTGPLFFPENSDNPTVNIDRGDGEIRMNSGHRLMSSVTMIAPSPDWFSGFQDYRPVNGGKWLNSFTIDTYPWDAGTDSGTTYTSSNSPTSPQVNTFQLTKDTVPDTNVFLKDNSNEVLPVATWKCDMVEATECREDRNARFFRNSVEGEKARTQKCRWLANKQGRINRFCARDSPVSFIPSASEVCRKTCGTCP